MNLNFASLNSQFSLDLLKFLTFYNDFSSVRIITTVEIFDDLEALAVDNGWAALIILLLGDPHLLEGGEGSKD